MWGRKSEEDNLYHELLELLQEGCGCLLCTLEERYARKYLEMMLYEMVNDIDTRKELTLSRGCCRHHAHLLAGMGDGLGAAIIYSDQVELFLQFIDREAEAGQRGAAKGISTRWNDHPECPVCLREREAGERFARALLNGLKKTEMRNAFAGGTGLCVSHFLRTMESVKDRGTRDFLFTAQRTILQSLLADLDEFKRKNDYRFRHEPFGREKDAWKRAISMLTGD
ncbi:MAG: DUF6062 family protein [bacterium]|nr:DUF6062 family protein [bacterium]